MTETGNHAQASGPPTWDLSPVSRAWTGRWRRWQRDAGSGSWEVTAAAQGLPSLDDSVRCRGSGICMGAKACSPGGKQLLSAASTRMRWSSREHKRSPPKTLRQRVPDAKARICLCYSDLPATFCHASMHSQKVAEGSCTTMSNSAALLPQATAWAASRTRQCGSSGCVRLLHGLGAATGVLLYKHPVLQ